MADTTENHNHDVAQDVGNYLKFLERAGFLCLVPGEEQRHAAASARQRARKLEELQVHCSTCTLCGLAEGRTHVVFGEGNPDADLMFVGEAPGRDEDLKARPFVGRAGQLLDRMIGEVGLKREDVFIGNVIKCRPPDNRDPQPDEIEACEPYLKAQIDLIQPRIIVALGRFASQTLIGEKISIMRERGNFYSYNGVPLMPTLHPAAVLRNMNLHEDVVDDLRRAVERIRD